jgi:hypothetical protein
MARHRSPPRHAGPRALATALACIAGAAAVLAFDVTDGLTVPAWTVVVPFLIYVAVASLTLGRASLRRRSVWLAGACATHAVFVVTTAAIVAATGSLSLATALPEAIVESPLATVIFIIGVPLTLLPFRGRLLERPPARPTGSRTAAPSAPLADRATSAASAGETPFAREARRRTAAAHATVEPAVAVEAAPPAPPVLPIGGATPAGGLGGSSRPPKSVIPPMPIRAAADAETVRIPFTRIAAQLPGEAFLVPVEQLGESMRSPHELLVSRSLVIGQLGEGRVEVAWTLVEDQFPTLGFALETAEIRRRYPDLRLSLPLDLVVAQLPPAVFSGSAPAVELTGLDRYPAPFQPSTGAPAPSAPPAPSVERPAPVAAALPSPAARAITAPTPVITRAVPPPPPPIQRTVIAPSALPPPPAQIIEARVVERPAIAAPVSAPPPIAVPAPPIAVPAPPIAVPAPPIAVPAPPAPAPAAPAPAPVETKAPAPARTTVVLPPAPRAVETPSPALLTEGHRLAARLAAFGALEVAAQNASGTTVLSLVTAGLPHEAIERAAARCAPLLSAAQLVTIHAERVSMVLTPVRDGVLVVALRPGSALALLEILVARACHEGPIAAAPAGAPRGLAAAVVDGRVAAMRGALEGFGPVVPAAFVDRASGLDVYVFSAGAETAQAAGEAARVVWQALVREGERALGRALSVVLREGTRRTVVHQVAAAPRPAMLAAAGVLALPGLAYRQAAQAAERLARV